MKVHRLWLLPVAAALALLASPADAKRPQPPAEGSFGRGPVPPVVTMAGKEPVVTLLVRPLFLIVRGPVRVEARVPRDEANRLLTIAWTSDVGTVGCTERALDGVDAPVLHTLDLPSTPPANYVFVAAVFNTLGQRRGRTEARIRTGEDR